LKYRLAARLETLAHAPQQPDPEHVGALVHQLPIGVIPQEGQPPGGRGEAEVDVPTSGEGIQGPKAAAQRKKDEKPHPAFEKTHGSFCYADGISPA